MTFKLKIVPAYMGFDAWDDNSFDGDPCECGWGETAAEAEADLLERLAYWNPALYEIATDVSRRGSDPCQLESRTRQGALRNGD